MTPQQKRVLAASRAFNGTCSADWIDDMGADGKGKISRFVARREELEKRYGCVFEVVGWRNKTKAFRLVDGPEIAPVPPSPVERFWAKVDKQAGDNPCWIWLGATNGEGYGLFGADGRRHRAHRYAYELLIDKIPDGLVIDHLCRVRNCVNPAHLEPVTDRENVLRGEGITAQRARATHCHRGHPLSGANLYVHPDGDRVCRTCKRDADNRYKDKAGVDVSMGADRLFETPAGSTPTLAGKRGMRLYAPDELGKDGYPAAWHESIKHAVRAEAGDRCVRCLHPYRSGDGEWSACDERCTHRGPARLSYRAEDGSEVVNYPVTLGTEAAVVVGYGKRVDAHWRILTVHHLDGDKANCRWWNLAALCQRCHLIIQGRVRMERVYPWEHSEWFKPYVAGYYAWTYLGEDLDRPATEARLDELLALELAA